MPDPMDTSVVGEALRGVAASFEYHADVEILLVGGAAGMLSGLLASSRTTTDCDVMVTAPPGAIKRLEEVARAVADERGLSRTWLNGDAELVRWKLPEGWRERRVPVLESGRLRVFAAGRADFIALKALAGRDQDIEDLRAMLVTPDECAFVRAHLDGYDDFATGATFRETIETARAIIDTMEDEHGA